MPRVEMFYAVKSNPDQRVLQTCLNEGVGFDVASIGEMEDLVKLGCRGDRMIFANPVKVKKQLVFAK